MFVKLFKYPPGNKDVVMALWDC